MGSEMTHSLLPDLAIAAGKIPGISWASGAEAAIRTPPWKVWTSLSPKGWEELLTPQAPAEREQPDTSDAAWEL